MRVAQRHFIAHWVCVVFIIASASTAVAPSAQEVSGSYLTISEVPVRRGPGIQHEVIATIPKGIKVNVVGREGYWLKIESKQGRQPGYIDEQYARPLESPQSAQAKKSQPAVAGPYRTTREAELREGPGFKYKVVTRLPADIKVHVVGTEGDWLRVESKRGNKPGYIEKFSLERWTTR
jgi:uncharacterized protein YgiM (DUF1202 family)